MTQETSIIFAKPRRSMNRLGSVTLTLFASRAGLALPALDLTTSGDID